jgi:putative membrane protein
MTSIPIAWGGFAIFGGLGLLFWILLIVAIVALVRGTRPAAQPPGAPAIGVLEERYARGEITREEFIERRTVLQGGPGGS